MTKTDIENEIRNFVAEYVGEGPPDDIWRVPLIGFADALHPGFESLKSLVDPGHELPLDILGDAHTVVAYFVPFTEAVVRGNTGEGLASPQWARVYEKTNTMLRDLGECLISLFWDNGWRAAISKEAAVFDREKIISRWSQRHIARLAGLGTFGLNNMLITEAGCCGRFGSVVTNLALTPDVLTETENCLYKRNGTCAACVRRCPTGALEHGCFDRQRCYARCLENACVYTQFGSSYASKAGEETINTGSEVCGKCLVGLPCSMKKP